MMEEMKFFIKVSLLTFIFGFSACARLNPFENNDQLQGVNSRYIAEWQWESWPMKQNVSENDIISPGPRINAALWKDSTGLNWYLFGGQPIKPDSEKIYSDIWKYSVVTRIWERVFPFMNPQENKGRHHGKIDGMVSFRVNFFDGHNSKRQKQENNNIVLCGRSTKKNVTTLRRQLWNYYSNRKSDTEKFLDESKSLAVYGPRTSKSNTVWQMDLKDKLWTHYVCCCDTSNYDRADPSPKNLTTETVLINQTKADIITSTRQNQTSINVKIDKTEDEIDLRQEHMTVSPSVTKKKKINQMKKNNRRKKEHKIEGASQSGNHSFVAESMQNYSKDWEPELQKNFSGEDGSVFIKRRDVKISAKHAEELANFPLGNKTEPVNEEIHDQGNFTENGKVQSKLVSKYCPDFTSDEEPVSWCDGNNDVLVTTDLSTSPIIIWVFDLKTSHWSQQQVDVAEGTQWSGCLNSSDIRYAGSADEIYILCSVQEYENSFWDNSTLNVSESVKKPQEVNSYKSIFRISWKRLTIESLGKINLEKFFKQPDHKEMWKNESRTVLQVIRLSDNEKIMLLAYKENVELWMLLENEPRGYFEPLENLWRGSAEKLFTKYNAANYNFRLLSERGNSDTALILNPRDIPYSEYWPRERGRFIIRILKNENFRNPRLANRSREHNLTYDLLQSDANSPSNDFAVVHTYNEKVLIFFGMSFAIFVTFGVLMFLKKCVTCPSRLFMQNDCQKSPPVIRYSVMHDDILYPVA